MMELKDTVNLMCSRKYKRRFLGEYKQLTIRMNKLTNLLFQYSSGTLDFKPSCPIDLLKQQICIMNMYKDCLEKRAKFEGIDLTDNELTD